MNSPMVPRAERIAQALLLVVLYATPALICLHGAVVADVDLWWHLRAGEWVLQHHAFPYTDPFSRGAMGKPWQAYSWLFELLLLKLYQRWDLVGVLAYSTSMVLAITVAVHGLMARLESDITKAVLLTMAVMICISPMFTPRPWLFTVFFFAIEMDLLMAARRGGGVRGLLWLAPLFALWANIHIQFIDGLLVLGIVALEATVERWRPNGSSKLWPAGVWLVLGCCVLAAMANPYGWTIYRVAYELASQSGVMKYVTELQPIPFRGFHDFLLLFMALGAAAKLAKRRSLPMFGGTLLALAAVVSFRSQRDVWLMAIVAATALAGGERGYLDDLSPSPPRLRRDTWGTRIWGWVERGAVTSGACVCVLVGALAMKVGNAKLQASVADQMPVKAVEAVKAHGYLTPLYNTYDWGGYLMWTLREPVSIDGRAALHGDKAMERSMATWFGEPAWANDPLFVSAGTVIAPVKMPLAQLLRLDPSFQLVYEDTVAAVFIRR